MGKLGEEEVKVDAASEVLSKDSDMDVKKETDEFIPILVTSGYTQVKESLE